MSKMEKFLKESNLSQEARKLIEEAWEEEKAAIAANLREDMKARYQEDLTQVVEGLNELVQSVITENMSDLYSEKRKLSEDRVRIRQSLSNFSNFANGILAEEVKQMRSETKHMNESVAKFIGFSNKILSEELHEFHDEKRQLVETRVKLVAEGTKQINEAKQRFISKTAEAAALFITEHTAKNMKELRTDIMEAKQNRFGRKLFETFATEFMNTQFNENSVLRALNETIARKDDQVLQANASLHEARKEAEEASRKVRVMEDRNARTAIIAELTKPLTASQRKIMESLLETSVTERLSEDFKKYHKAVLNESAVKTSRPAVTTQANSVLTESTGARTTNTERQNSVENCDLSDDDKAILASWKKNAGIR